MRTFHIRQFFLLLVISIFLIPLCHASAQSAAGIKLIPASVEKAANPGDVFTETFTISNVSTEDKEYFLYKKNISGVKDEGVPVFTDEGAEKSGYEITDWINLQSEPIKIPAKSELTFPVTITVPTTASPGSHFGALFISQEPPKFRENGAGVGYEVASIISIRISGEINDSARVRSFSTGKLFYSSKNIDFNAKIENQGNILIRPRGPLTITSIFSTRPSIITINDEQAGVFPGTSRDFNFNWTDEGLGFGKYEAILALVYDGESGQKTIDASIVFWVFPTKVILSIIGGFVAILLIGYFFTKFYINQALMRAAGGRRIPTQRYRRQVGISRFTFISVSLLALVVFFLLVLLVFFA